MDYHTGLGYRERQEARERARMEADGIVVAFSGRVFLTVDEDAFQMRAERQKWLIEQSGLSPREWIDRYAGKFAAMYARGEFDDLGAVAFRFALEEK